MGSSTAPETAAARLLEVLVARGETLATAESLTGGLVCGALTDMPGSSRVVLGGVVAYAVPVKTGVLGVEQAVVDGPGVVSRACALQMARGVRRVTGADWGVSTTGEAGPDAAGDAPVGTVWVGVSGPGREQAWRLDLGSEGGRAAVRSGAVAGALDLLLGVLGSGPDDTDAPGSAPE